MAGMTYNNFTQLDPMGSLERGQNLAMNKMAMDDMSQQRTLRQQAVGQPGGYTPEAHKELLMNAGYFEEAQDLDDLMNKQVRNKQDAMERGLNIMERTGQLVQKVGAPAWPMFRGSMIAAGLADEGSLPAEYNEQAAQIAQNFTQNSSGVFRMLRVRSGDKQQDITNIDGKITYGEPYSPGTSTALEKNTQFLASTMGISEEEAAQIMLTSKDKSDSAVYQDLFKTALRASFGDEEEAARIAKSGLEAVREVRGQQRPPKTETPAPPAAPSSPQPVRRPGGPVKPVKFEVGKVYTDASGNKAKYLGPDQWEPVR